MSHATNHPAPEVPCKQCGVGQMIRRKVPVLGIAGTVLRYLTAVPAALTALLGLVLFISSGQETAKALAHFNEQAAPYVEHYLPLTSEETVNFVLSGGTVELGSVEFAHLYDAKKMEYAVSDIVAERNASVIAASATSGVAIFLIIAGTIFAPIGWLFGIAKRRLVCNTCGASLCAA